MSKEMEKQFDKSKENVAKYAIGYLVLVEHTKPDPGLSSVKMVPQHIRPLRVTDVLGKDSKV